MTSIFLDSDSDSHHSLSSNSSDDNLPTYDIPNYECSPAKQAKLCQPYSITTFPTSSSSTFFASKQVEVKLKSPQKSLHLSDSSAVQSPLRLSPSLSKKRCLSSPGGVDSGRFPPISNPGGIASKISLVDSTGSKLPVATSPGGMTSKISNASSHGGMTSKISNASSSPGGMSSKISNAFSPLRIGSRPNMITSPSGTGSRLSESPSSSPLKLTERYQKTLHQNSKLTRKVENLTANIMSRCEKKSKLEKYMTEGGIRGLSNGLDRRDSRSVSSDGEDEPKPLEPLSLCPIRQRPQHQQREADKFPLPLHPPGLPVLVHTPSLLSHLHPPSTGAGKKEDEGAAAKNYQQSELLSQKEDEGAAAKNHQQSELLSQFICDRWFSLQYTSKPCPMSLWEWLFQITCLSCDQHIGQAALSNLTSLLIRAGNQDHKAWPVLVPNPTCILQVLRALGADQKMLHDTTEQAPSQPPEDAKDVTHTLCSPSIITNLIHLLTYLPLAVQARPDDLSTQHLHSLIIMLATLSLDSGLLQQDTLQILHVMSCAISVLLTAIPESCWLESLASLTATLGGLSSHHHDCLHLCKLLTPSSSRPQQLQRLICRHCLGMLLFPRDHAAGVPSSLQDWELAYRVVKHFYDKPSPAFHYYSMYSVICMLRILVSASSQMNWPSADKEGEVMEMLADLEKRKIKDHLETSERAPVKDLLIIFKLEMDSRKNKRTLHQMDLFAYDT